MAEAGRSTFRVKLLARPGTADDGAAPAAECAVTVPYDVDRAQAVPLPALLKLFELARGAAAFELDWGGLRALFAATPWLLKAQETLVDTEAGSALIPQVSVLCCTRSGGVPVGLRVAAWPPPRLGAYRYS